MPLYQNVEDYINTIEIYQALGSTIKGYTNGVQLATSTGTALTLTNQLVRWLPIWIPQPSILTGVMFFQVIQGSYTANNNSKIGLYTYDGAGNITRVAQCADDTALFKAAANSLVTKPFSATYTAARGLYFASLIYCRSAESTAPQIASGPTMSNLAKGNIDFTNSAKMFPSLSAQTDLPAGPTAMSALTSITTTTWLAVY